MRTWNARDAKRRRSLPLCAAPAHGEGPGWKNFWHHLEGKTEMTVQTKAPESQFAYVVLAARRARQIMAGAPPMLGDTLSLKPTRGACAGGNRRLIELEFRPGKSVGQDSVGVEG